MNQYSKNIRSNMQLFVGMLAGVTLAFAMGLVSAQERSAEQVAEEAAAMAEKRQAITPSPDGQAYRPASDTTWFRDAKFGLFVQWGISAIPGGVWRGDNYFGITEWLWRRSEADAETYKALAEQLNPEAYDAREWVGLARDAGARYMVAAAKLGFYYSQYQDWEHPDGASKAG